MSDIDDVLKEKIDSQEPLLGSNTFDNLFGKREWEDIIKVNSPIVESVISTEPIKFSKPIMPEIQQEVKGIRENTDEMKGTTNDILARHNEELVKISRQVEEVQKSRINLSEINKNLKKELAESQKELKKSRRDRIVNYFLSGIAIIIALLTWLHPIKW